MRGKLEFHEMRFYGLTLHPFSRKWKQTFESIHLNGPIAIQCITDLTLMASHECHVGRELIPDNIEEESYERKMIG